MIRPVGHEAGAAGVRRGGMAPDSAAIRASADVGRDRSQAAPALPARTIRPATSTGFREAMMEGAARDGTIGRANLLFEVQRLAQVQASVPGMPERATDAMIAYRDALDRMSVVLLPMGRRSFSGLRA
ncbi:MAG: hypothetical protein VYB54_10030 [Pseudomonadota bacterium]|nr:hypothetical protein [Pseudomonadota bacterium]